MFSGDVDAAIVGKLLGDATLMALVPDGVFFDIARSGSTQFVIVKLMTHSVERMFTGRAYEEPLYLIKAVAFGTGTAVTDAAARRIDVLFDGPNGEGAALTVTGYASARTKLAEYVRYPEPDSDNADARWQHSGGMYSVFVSPT